MTGAAPVLGLATARAFAEVRRIRRSCRLARKRAPVQSPAAEELASSKGYKTLAVCCDVSDDTQVEARLRDTISRQRLDASMRPTTMGGSAEMPAETADTLPVKITIESWVSICGGSGAP